ncbi:MAG: ComF family protein, partial [Myxococcota bacterium]|nr:ComF family protein [Myxococcota bacterium]
RSPLFEAFLDILLPALCALCGADAGPSGLCPRCQRRLDEGVCAEPPAPPGLFAWRSGGLYAGEWADWMLRFKYPQPGLLGLDPAAEIVARALVLRAARRMPGAAPEAVLPVPDHPERSRERGFVPTRMLARFVAKAVGAPLLGAGLERRRDTPSQTGLGAGERRQNLAGAFGPARALPRRIWIVDDLFTTGATLREAARAARRGGAREVGAVACLWTPR